MLVWQLGLKIGCNLGCRCVIFLTSVLWLLPCDGETVGTLSVVGVESILLRSDYDTPSQI